MLRAVTEELSQILDASAKRGHTLSVDDAARQLQCSPLFQRALEQLLSRDVDVSCSQRQPGLNVAHVCSRWTTFSFMFHCNAYACQLLLLRSFWPSWYRMLLLMKFCCRAAQRTSRKPCSSRLRDLPVSPRETIKQQPGTMQVSAVVVKVWVCQAGQVSWHYAGQQQPSAPDKQHEMPLILTKV